MNLRALSVRLAKEMCYNKKVKSYNYHNFKEALIKYNEEDWKNYIPCLSQEINLHNKYKLPIDNEYFDLFLIHWPPKVETQVHGHSNFGCLQKVLQGSLLEKRFDIHNGNFQSKKILHVNDTSFINDKTAYHKILNPSDDDSYSLHIYHPKK